MRGIVLLLVLVWFLPFQGVLTDVFAQDHLWVASLKDLLLISVLLTAILRAYQNGRLKRLGGYEKLFLSFTGLCLLYVFFSPSTLRAVLELRALVLYPSIAVIVMYSEVTPGDLLRLLRALVLVGLVTMTYGFVQYATSFDAPYRTIRGDYGFRVSRFGAMAMLSTFPGRADFGLFLIAIFLLVYQVRLWRSSVAISLFRSALLTGTAVCIFLTYSRTTWIALFIGFLAALFLGNRKKAFAAVLLVALVLVWVLPTLGTNTSDETQEATSDLVSLAERVEVWSYASGLIVSQPLGWGLGTVGGQLVSETPEYATPQENVMFFTDNTFLKVFVQGGVVLEAGFLVLLFSICMMARNVIRRTTSEEGKDIAIWCIASLIAAFVSFFTVDYLESVSAMFVYWLVVGLLGRELAPSGFGRHRVHALTLENAPQDGLGSSA
jgi:hypothetical protein